MRSDAGFCPTARRVAGDRNLWPMEESQLTSSTYQWTKMLNINSETVKKKTRKNIGECYLIWTEDFKHKCKQHFKSLLTFYNIKNKHLFFKNKTQTKSKGKQNQGEYSQHLQRRNITHMLKKKPLIKKMGQTKTSILYWLEFCPITHNRKQ